MELAPLTAVSGQGFVPYYRVPVHPGCTNLPVQPGCTNVSLSPLLQSMTHARDDGCAGCSQAPAKTEYKSSMAAV